MDVFKHGPDRWGPIAIVSNGGKDSAVLATGKHQLGCLVTGGRTAFQHGFPLIRGKIQKKILFVVIRGSLWQFMAAKKSSGLCK
jgi:hypothetical protein